MEQPPGNSAPVTSQRSSRPPSARKSDGSGTGSSRKSFDPKQREIQESPNSIFVHTSEKVNPPSLVRILEEALGQGAVAQYFFREKQNFGFVQFNRSEDVDKAISLVSGKTCEGATVTLEKSRGRSDSRPGSASSTSSGSGSRGSGPAGRESSLPTVPLMRPTSLLTASANITELMAQPVPPVNAPAEPSNALVVKNLPFQLKFDEFEQMLNTYEFKPVHIKYHYESGAFRGIAFIKYRSAEHAAAMLDIINALDVTGRRIRAEFKKTIMPKTSDLEGDEESLVLWDQLLKFKEDPASSELAFSASLTNQQRKQIHYLAERLDLVHYSQGEGDNRFIIVTKRGPKQATSPTQSRHDSASQTAPQGLQQQQQPQSGHTDPVAAASAAAAAAAALASVHGGERALERNWRARTQAEKEQKSLQPRTAKAEPTRQPRLPEANQKGFSDEYRQSRKAQPPRPPPVLNPTAPVFVPGSHSPVVARNNATPSSTSPVTAPLLATVDKT